MLDRVAERRRAAQLARHYRDQEGLPIAEIARRLGRAEATIKSYLYDPTGDKARAVKARYRGVCRGCGAPTAPRNGKGDAYAYCKRCHPGRSRRNGHGSGFAKRCAHGERATALRRPRMTDRARTHADAAERRSHDYRAQNGPHRPPSPICTAAGRRPAPTPSPAPERPGHNAVVTRTLACAWPSLNGAPTVAAHATAARPCGRRRPVTAGPGGATATCACKPPRIGPSASTSTTLATAAKEGRQRSRTAERADMRTFGEEEGRRRYVARPCFSLTTGIRHGSLVGFGSWIRRRAASRRQCGLGDTQEPGMWLSHGAPALAVAGSRVIVGQSWTMRRSVRS